jgi:ferritin-like metal-binding protein YciE
MATTTKRKTKKAPARKSATRKSASAKRTRAQKQVPANGSMLQEYFLHALKDIYWAEKALTKALPKMAKESTSSELKKAFTDHLAITRKQITRLEQVFGKLGEKAQAKKCDAMKGLIEESESIISETKDDTATRDAALIIAAQKVEHYEIAAYGDLVQLARTLKRTDIAKVLNTTLDEEKKTDVLLTKIAEQGGTDVEASREEAGEGKQTVKESIMALFS